MNIRLFISILSLALGIILINGGIKKFKSQPVGPRHHIENIKNGEWDQIPDHVLKIRNYIFGMKQTGYFWQFLGISELLAGLLLVTQFYRIVGLVISVPITLQILLFHIFLEPHDVGELIYTAVMFLTNTGLLAYHYPDWKGILSKPKII
ncbi:hypothetical protein JCM31826_12710 [Thermaurantimonas aggregans]|uniref:DoxX family protein n=1 Tax=Thermaurantimonas aggregans TaxID=2173829 RepID=A0A401XL93_9FLAO|nr:DoxX protein [Thermaurantimonas aggregans]MCX8148283.1 DoxX protein [Thermaurantimonas aggregans]GCD77789.1 hypothetical protein JCM31826_12710 [Thermaurantimonas aggregans]